jgi:hypothetical protein
VIGLTEVLFLLALFLFIAGPVAAGIVVWKYVIKPRRDAATPAGRK